MSEILEVSLNIKTIILKQSFKIEKVDNKYIFKSSKIEKEISDEKINEFLKTLFVIVSDWGDDYKKNYLDKDYWSLAIKFTNNIRKYSGNSYPYNFELLREIFNSIGNEI